MIIIMWARVCIILHNLIIRIEGDNFDEKWRDGLVQRGLDHGRGGGGGGGTFSDADDDDEHGDDLRHLGSASDTNL